MDMHRELKLLKLNDRRDYHMSELCHKNIYYDTTASLSKYFVRTPARNHHGTRQRNKSHMVVPRTKTLAGQKALEVRGPYHWNRLPNEIRLTVNYQSFAQEIRAKGTPTLDNHPI